MKKYLLISEKPSLMRAVRDAYFRGGFNKKMEVDFIALHGHVCTLAQPEQYDPKWKSWKMEDIPLYPSKFQHIPTDLPLVNEIRDKLNETSYDGLINCTDAEREGQNIFYSLYDYLKLKLPVLRFWASDLTETRLIECWGHLRDDLKDPMLVNLTSAALYRAQLDWLVGMNFTRVVSINNKRVIPVGRVMSVVLSMMAKREEEIKNFKPSTSYDVEANYINGLSGTYDDDGDHGNNGVFATEKEANDFMKSLSNKGKIVSIESKENLRNAPLLYSLGDLQNDANKQYGYTLAQSLKIIQNLYEKKILSYPRTDSNYLTTGEAKRMDAIVEAVRCIPSLNKVKINPLKIKNYASSRYVNDAKVSAHYAIVFTGKEFNFNELSEAEQNIATLCGKRIIATLMDPSTTISFKMDVDIDGRHFYTSQSFMTKSGFESLYGAEIEAIGDIQKVKKGDIIEVSSLELSKVTTTCPPRYNDASINKAMINVGSTLDDKELSDVLKGKKSKDEGGIGTPATRAGIIEKLLMTHGKNGGAWVIRKGKSFMVTDDGLDVAHALSEYIISSPILTAQWEKKLSDIADGKLEGKIFEKEMSAFIHDQCDALKNSHLQNASTVKSGAVKLDLTCPFCNEAIYESDKFFMCDNYRKNKSCGFIIGKKTAGAVITEKDIMNLSKDKTTVSKSFVNKEGKKFNAVLKLNHDTKKIVFAFEDNSKEIGHCNCGGTVVKRKSKSGENYYSCGQCGRYIMEKQFGHKFNAKEIKLLFDGNKLKADCVSKSGKAYTAILSFDQENKIKMDFDNNK